MASCCLCTAATRHCRRHAASSSATASAHLSCCARRRTCAGVSSVPLSASIHRPAAYAPRVVLICITRACGGCGCACAGVGALAWGEGRWREQMALKGAVGRGECNGVHVLPPGEACCSYKASCLREAADDLICMHAAGRMCMLTGQRPWCANAALHAVTCQNPGPHTHRHGKDAAGRVERHLPHVCGCVLAHQAAHATLSLQVAQLATRHVDRAPASRARSPHAPRVSPLGAACTPPRPQRSQAGVNVNASRHARYLRPMPGRLHGQSATAHVAPQNQAEGRVTTHCKHAARQRQRHPQQYPHVSAERHSGSACHCPARCCLGVHPVPDPPRRARAT